MHLSISQLARLTPPRIRQVVSHVIIGLKTVKGTKQLKLDPTIYDRIQKERICVGDVIYIEANSGAVKRVGRCDAYSTEFDLEVRPLVCASVRLCPASVRL